MKKIFTMVALAAASMFAAPAALAADFTGPRVGVTVGYDDVADRDGVTYGIVAGVDAPVAKGVIVGAEATLEDSTVKGLGISASRELGLAVRAGVKLTDSVLAYGKVGYAKARFEAAGTNAGVSLEGVRYGGGIEYAVTKNLYANVEYRRSEYENGVGGRNGVLVGAVIRF